MADLGFIFAFLLFDFVFSPHETKVASAKKSLEKALFLNTSKFISDVVLPFLDCLFLSQRERGRGRESELLSAGLLPTWPQ